MTEPLSFTLYKKNMIY